MASRQVSWIVVLFVASLCLVALGSHVGGEQSYSEELFLRQLPDGKVLTVLDAATTWAVHPLDFAQARKGEACVEAQVDK